MQIPHPNPHRHSRRKLGRGQYPRLPPITITVANTGDTAILIFPRPVFVTGTIALHVTGRVQLSQNVANPTRITITFDADLSFRDWTLTDPPLNLASTTGAPILGGSGNFGGIMPIPINEILIADGAGGQLGGRGVILGDGSVALATNTFTIDAAGNVTALSYAGDGSNLTGIDYSQITGSPPNPFDQTLNVADSPTFAILHATTLVGSLDWANLANVPPFNTAATTTAISAVGGVLTVGQPGVAIGSIVLVSAPLGTVSTINSTGAAIFNLPADNGGAGQVIQTDGLGNLSWTTRLSTLEAAYAATQTDVSTLQTDVASLQSTVASILALLATGVTGTLTPVTGTLQTSNGIVQSIS